MHFYPTTIPHLHQAKCLKSLGMGGYGRIKLYVCKERENGCKCKKLFVVKHCRLNDIFARKQTLKEYTIGTILNHPSIRKPIDIDIRNKCLIYEYFPSEDLFTLLKKKHDSKVNILHLFCQLLDAIEYMHDVGIAHMDIKLENILVDTHYHQIKLIDFGEAFVFHDINHILNIIPCKGQHGTLEYMPPEEFVGEYYNPEKVDVWACGITLYCILNNAFPWEKAVLHDKNYFRYLEKGHLLLQKNNDFYNTLKMFLEPNPLKRLTIKNVKPYFIQYFKPNISI